MDRLVRTTHSPAETEDLGAGLAALLPSGALVALEGGLGSGKTCFVRGMARVLAPAACVHSPTFTLVNPYGSGDVFLHADLYRLAGPAEVADLGYEELFGGLAICAVEWADRADGLLPECRVAVSFAHEGPEKRRICIEDNGVLQADWVQQLREPAA